ncbi:MAG: type II secretion system protein GspM [Gammaproteobacteria bacterium]|nr:type II secretion system protein GspM [Gammaproteobacteria bacterium]
MIERFRQLETREQAILLSGIVIATLLICWQFIWVPLHAGTAELDEAVDDKSRLVVDLQRASGLQSTAAVPAGDPSQTLMLLVEQTSRPLGLALSRTRMDGNDVINVSFQDAPFHLLVAWLTELEQVYGVTVVSASVADARSPGLVTGQVRLDRS